MWPAHDEKGPSLAVDRAHEKTVSEFFDRLAGRDGPAQETDGIGMSDVSGWVADRGMQELGYAFDNPADGDDEAKMDKACGARRTRRATGRPALPPPRPLDRSLRAFRWRS